MIDTSCVIALDAAALLPQLVFVFDRLLLPKAVRSELNKRRRTKDRIRALQREYAFIVPCNDYDQVAVDTVLTDLNRRKKDRGEAESIVQASKFSAVVVMDDRWGRNLAERFLLECHGTLWVLERLHGLGLLSAQSVRRSLLTFKKEGIRFPLREANDLLKRIHEQLLRT